MSTIELDDINAPDSWNCVDYCVDTAPAFPTSPYRKPKTASGRLRIGPWLHRCAIFAGWSGGL